MAAMKRVIVSIPPESHEKARLLALREQQWNFSELIRHLIDDYVSREGKLEGVTSALDEEKHVHS